MSTISKRFFDAGEPYAGGLFEFPDREPIYRYANALKRYYEFTDPTPYGGGRLYPCGAVIGTVNGSGLTVRPDYSYTFSSDLRALKDKVDDECYTAFLDEAGKVTGFPTPHTVGGAGYTHSFINYGRILNEGLCSYRSRVETLPDDDFRAALLLVLDGIDIYREKLLSHLRSRGGVHEGLIEALEHTDRAPTTLYEAVVLYNFVYYVDGCDDIGRLDQHLIKFYNGEDIVDLLHELYRNIDCNNGWSGALGPDYNALTLQCIRASRYIRRPSLQLRIKPDMPDEVWGEVYASLATSCGQPALYNENAFQEALMREFPEIPEEDRIRLSFGGCTETMLEGISNVGSEDLGINTALIYDQFTRAHLSEFDNFDDYFDAFTDECARQIAEALDIVTEYRKTRGKHRPQPVRTLFVDDCIDRRLDFNAGGARYYWSISNVAGLINVIDSLSAVRELIFESGRYSAESFMAALDAQDPEFLAACRECPAFGNDDERVDALGADFAGRIYESFNQRECWPSGKYITASNQFITYESAGIPVGATPDGRAAGTPLCDSLGSVHGKDKKGPTALLNSVAALPLNRVLGTPILNLRMRKEHLSEYLRPLTEAFFKRGGMQLQITCVSREEILDAIAHPEKHENLIVRIGGYSEYFNRLSPGLQQTVLARTEY